MAFFRRGVNGEYEEDTMDMGPLAHERMKREEPCPIARWEDDGGPPALGDADAPNVEATDRDEDRWVELCLKPNTGEEAMEGYLIQNRLIARGRLEAATDRAIGQRVRLLEAVRDECGIKGPCGWDGIVAELKSRGYGASAIEREDKNPVCECRRNDCPLCGANGWPDPEDCSFCAEGECPEHGWSFNDSVPDGADYKPVTLEAHGLVFGDRGANYGHPLDDFSRSAAHWTAHLADIIRPGCAIVAEDVGPMMVLFKMSRQRNQHKRDNLADGAGYCETTNRVHAERERRARLKAREASRRSSLVQQIADSTKNPQMTFALLAQLLEEEHRATSV